MLEDASRTCRLDELLCLLTQSQLISNTQHRHLPAVSSTLQLFIKTHHHLMSADGPLSHQHRHYIALLVRSLQLISQSLKAKKVKGRIALDGPPMTELRPTGRHLPYSVTCYRSSRIRFYVFLWKSKKRYFTFFWSGISKRRNPKF